MSNPYPKDDPRHLIALRVFLRDGWGRCHDTLPRKSPMQTYEEMLWRRFCIANNRLWLTMEAMRVSEKAKELPKPISKRTFKTSAADKLAYECAKMIQSGAIDPRSGIGDELLDYLEIGMPGKPQDVPEWIKQYEKAMKEVAYVE